MSGGVRIEQTMCTRIIDLKPVHGFVAEARAAFAGQRFGRRLLATACALTRTREGTRQGSSRVRTTTEPSSGNQTLSGAFPLSAVVASSIAAFTSAHSERIG
jgi:hypothetical protein